MSDRYISVCIPTYNRFEMLFEAFEKIHDDPRVLEIVIVDDASEQSIFDKVQERALAFSKITLHRNTQNKDCYANKYTSLSYAATDWCILLDSDNIIGVDYLDAIYKVKEWRKDTIYAPVFAKPHFDYREFADKIITKENVHNYMDKGMFNTALNTANYFVNRNVYMKCWSGDINPVTTDSIFISLQFLKNNNKIYFVPDLEYKHLVHPGSHYQNNVDKTPAGLLKHIEEELRNLK